MTQQTSDTTRTPDHCPVCGQHGCHDQRHQRPTPAPDLAIFHGPVRTSIEASTNRSSRKVYAPTLIEALEQMHPDDRAALVQFADAVLKHCWSTPAQTDRGEMLSRDDAHALLSERGR